MAKPPKSIPGSRFAYELLFGKGRQSYIVMHLNATEAFKQDFLATDCMPDLVKLARKNVTANDLTSEHCAVQLYEWGGPRQHAVLRRPFDVVVASEVTALEGGHD